MAEMPIENSRSGAVDFFDSMKTTGECQTCGADASATPVRSASDFGLRSQNQDGVARAEPFSCALPSRGISAPYQAPPGASLVWHAPECVKRVRGWRMSSPRQG